MTAWLWIIVPGLLLGFAVQRGSLCAVSAVGEVVRHGRWRHFWSIWQCPAWAWAMAWLALAIFAIPVTGNAGQIHNSWLLPIVGGIVFGAGAWLNGGCTFGTVSRLGHGEISFVLTLLAMLAGQLWALPWFSAPATAALSADDSSVAGWRVAWQLVLAALLLLSLRQAFKQRVWRWRVLRQPVWPAALAMPVLAASVTLVLLSYSQWPRTSVAAQALSGNPQELQRWALLPAIIIGAMLAAMLARSFTVCWEGLRAVPRRIGGGVLMGYGSVLIPGGNSHLLVVGIPAQQVSALLGYLSIVLCLFVLTLASRYGSGKAST